MDATTPGTRRRRRRRFWLWILLAGTASAALLVAADRSRQLALVRTSAQLRALSDIRHGVAVSHLWLEEHVAGDEVDLGAIDAGLDRSFALARSLAGSADRPAPRALAVPALRARAARLERRLEEFRKISAERRRGLADSRPVGVGSAIDVVYDAVFAELLAETRELELELEARMDRDRALSTASLWAVVVLWGALVVAATLALRGRERRQRQMEAELAASRRQLLQSQRMDAAGRVAGGLAHDLNNYLAAIRGHCELVRRKRPPGDRTARRMEAAIRVLGKASSLIDRLQAFHQPRPAEVEVVDVNGVLEGLLKMMRPSLGESIRLETRLAPEPWNVEVDVDQLEQALVNLLVNARDAQPQGGAIRIATANRSGAYGPAGSPDGDWVEITVEDDGPGIAPEVRERLFEPFATTRSRPGNSGLGLAVVYGIVRGHGGTIEARSEPGSGARFVIRLPRSEKPARRRQLRCEPEREVRSGQERILLVDDHRDFREAARDLLADLGYRVTAAASAEEALAIWDRDPEFALVVTDLVMPGLDGRRLVARLRRRRPVPAIVLSGHREEVVESFDLEDLSFVRKSGSVEELGRKVREILDAHAVVA